MDKSFSGYGGKRPLKYISYLRLFLDPKNPRLPIEAQDKDENNIKETLKKYFYLEEIAVSMATNGYFDEEPLVAIPKSLPVKFLTKTYDQLKNDATYNDFLDNPSTEFIVVEGNRRLSTVKYLMSGDVSNFPLITSSIRDDLQNLPVIIFPKRSEVISYLGARHIIGVKKWDAYAKARYIASMKEEHDLSLDEIQKSVGDTTNSAKKTYTSYKLIEIIENEYELYDSSKSKENFSYLMLALGLTPIKEFVGLPKSWKSVDSDNPIPKENIGKLFLLFSWLFGEGKEKTKVINESRDITNKLTSVISDAAAQQYLIEFRDLNAAYEKCGGDQQLLITYLKRIYRDLGLTMPLISNPNNRNNEVDSLVKDCERILDSIKKIKS